MKPVLTVEQIALRRLTRARVQLLLNPRFIFWGTCALHLKPVAYPAIQDYGGHIGTDGSNLYFNPEFIASNAWSDDELIGVMAHEVSHVVKGDNWRRGAREPRPWNLATDARIDPELMASGLTMPSHGSPELDARLQNPANRGRSAEEIYCEFQQRQSGQGDDGDPLAGDILDPRQPDGSPMTPKEREAAAETLKAKWDQIARQAAQIAKSQGHLPAGMEHLVTPIRPKLDPLVMMRHFVTMCRRDDWSWSRANRRYLWQGVYLPSLYSEGVGGLLVGIDTSGSTAGVVAKFLGFLGAILSDVKPEWLALVECDAKVHATTWFGPDDELPAQVPVHGYGGTSMRPIWDWAADEGIEPTAAIILTDLCMTAHDCGDPQPWPTLWVTSTPGTVAPWGETVEMEG